LVGAALGSLCGVRVRFGRVRGTHKDAR